MKKFLALVFAIILTANVTMVLAQDTFSICAVDPVTGEVGSAGARLEVAPEAPGRPGLRGIVNENDLGGVRALKRVGAICPSRNDRHAITHQDPGASLIGGLPLSVIIGVDEHVAGDRPGQA